MAQINFLLTLPASIATPAVGYIAFFADPGDNTVKFKDSAGVVHDLITVSVEQIQDVVGAMATSTATVDFTYDDVGGILSAVVPLGSITAGHLSFDPATQVELDAHINNITGAHAASAISYNGGTGISATDVEGALDELATEKANAAVTLTAGAGLSGGGDLSTNRTFDVAAAGDGSITLAGDAVGVGVLATDAQHGVRGGGTQHALVISGGAAGFLSGTDKQKLDTVSANAAVASVAGTPPIVSSGGANPTISISVSPGAATTVVGATRSLSVTGATALTINGTNSADLSADRAFALATSPASAATVVGTARTLSTSGAILIAGGTSSDLSADRIFSLVTSPAAAATVVGTGRLFTVSGATALTINGTNSADLSADRAFALATSPASAATVVGTGRTLSTTSPIQIAGGTSADLSADRTLSILPAVAATGTSGGNAGSISAVDQERFSAFFNVAADFNIVGDLVTTNATSSVTGTSLTDSTSPFTAADVGKRVTIPYAGAGSGVNAAQLTTTISAFVNAGQVTLQTGATNNKVNVSINYGTDCTAGWTALVAAINALTYPNVMVFFPRTSTNAFGCPIPLVFNKSCHFAGQGGGHTADSGDYTKIGGTRLAWWGTSSDGGTDFGAWITFTPTGVQALKRPSLTRLWLDGRNNDQNQALIALKLASCHGAMLHEVFFMDCLGSNLWLDVTAVALTEAKDCTRFAFDALCFRQLDNTPSAVTTGFTTSSTATLTTTPQNIAVAANTLPTAGYAWMQVTIGECVLVKYTAGGGTTTLTNVTIAAEFVHHTPTLFNGALVVQATPGNGCAGIFNGSTTANTCCGSITNGQVSYGTTFGPGCWSLWNSDLVVFNKIEMNGGSNLVTGGRRQKPGYRFNGSAVSSALAARNIEVISGDPGGSPGGAQGGISAMGLTNAGTALTASTGPHFVRAMELANGAPVPTVEGSALLEWSSNGGLNPGGGVGTPSTVQQSTIVATTAIASGSVLRLPPQWGRVGLTLRWEIPITKTAAGTTARTLASIRLGTTGTTADGAIATMVSTTPTAALDNGMLIITWALSTEGTGTSAAGVSNFALLHQGGNTGFINAAGVTGLGTPTGFDSTLPGQIISVAITAGTGETIQVGAPLFVEVLKGANP